LIAALFVDERPGGCYVDHPGIDAWGESRDARLYPGPHPVVAHPPCSRWCRLAGFVETRNPDYKRGEDGGCFAAALAAVRRWGGVLEHPAYSDAWQAHELNRPPTGGGWVNADFVGGWTCYVEQVRYGHPARKATWLYAVAPVLPKLRWGYTDLGDDDNKMVSGLYREKPREGRPEDRRDRLRGRAASATPPAFREQLLAIARSCR
jgi:hypothetical protein